MINVSTVDRALVSQLMVPIKWIENKHEGLSTVPTEDISDV